MKVTKLILSKNDLVCKVTYEGETDGWVHGGTYCNVYKIEDSYVVTNAYNGKPVKVCGSYPKLIDYLKKETGLKEINHER